MASRPTIRPFRASDTPRLVSILESVFGEYGMRFDPDGYDRDVQSIEARYAPPEGVFYAVELEGRVAGFAGADMPRPKVAELHRVYIDPAARGHGLGGLLVDVVEAWARERDAELLELWSDVRFFHAHRMYARLGYALMGQRQLADPDRSIEFGFRRLVREARVPVEPTLSEASSVPLAQLLGTDREPWVGMLAAAILDSRTLVHAGRMRDGGHEVPSALELFSPRPEARDVSVLELPGKILAGFKRAGSSPSVRPHPLFAR